MKKESKKRIDLYDIGDGLTLVCRRDVPFATVLCLMVTYIALL